MFILNPLSVKRKGVNLEKLIRENLDQNRFEYTIRYSEYHGHALDIAEAFKSEYRIIIAAGGDGTVNQVSDALVGTNNIMGIIPLGSGNGLARDLRIPVKATKAIKRINSLNTRVIDSGLIGGKHFINMAGIGFDAEIAHDFAGSVRRGLLGYTTRVIRRFFRYKALDYTVFIEGVESNLNAFMISFANTGQYGYNAYISPEAQPDDGLVDVCIIKKLPVCAAPILATRLFLKNIDRSKYVKIVSARNISLRCDHAIKGHIDGEPTMFCNEVHLQLKEKALTVIV